MKVLCLAILVNFLNKMSNEKKVELVAWLQNPRINWDVEDSAACGARGCFSELNSLEIHKREIAREDYEQRKEIIFNETSGRGHGAVLDQSEFLFSIDNLTRASTLFLCGPQYASHLQQSLRRATAERGFYIPEINGARDIMEEQFKLYSKIQEAEVPSEDARFILPLYTKTTIQTKLDARELMHLHNMSQKVGVPEEVKNTVEQMIGLSTRIAPRLMKDRKTNYEVLAWLPSSQLFARDNKTIENLIEKYSSNHEGAVLISESGIPMSEEQIYDAVMNRNEDEFANMKHYHFTFLAPMSLACFHQATRQRTWDQSVQALFQAIKKGDYIVPPKIQRSKFEREYKELNNRSIQFVRDNLENPKALGIVPHSLVVYDLIHVNGWNAVHSIGKRTCTEAQWEIRGIAQDMARKIEESYPELGKYAVPQGITYGKCPEKNSCGKCG